MKKDMKYWVWLSSVPGIGSKKAQNLLDCFKEPEEIWNASELDYRAVKGISRKDIGALTNSRYRDGVEKHLERIQKQEINIITIHDDEYPYNLKNIYDPPVVLYTRGIVLKDEKAIAVIGSRKATSYGLNMAEQIAYELSKADIAVVSGMARGIDSFAHSGSLKGGGRTLAVLGCGPDIAYPSENSGLMRRIAESGAIISEYIPGTAPLPHNFPARNRIISGLSLGVVVIEANERSGSLITANFALEQGREVFAVPGNLSSSNSVGTNRLIRDGAKIVTEIEDILEELKIFTGANTIDYKMPKKKSILDELVGEELTIARILQDGPIHVDLIAKQSGLSIQLVNSTLIMLELRGVVEQMPGKIFSLVS